jgi:lipoprotein-anchoring transpeptidase ErfK/SrfK
MSDRISMKPGELPSAGTSQRSARRAAPVKLHWPRVALVLLVLAVAVAPVNALATSGTHRGRWHPTADRRIDIDLSAQWLTAYEDDVAVFGTAVSTGIDGHETPAGAFEIEWMLEWETMAGEDYYLEDVPYVMYFADYLAIHGAYWHDNFGEPMSHGCVNLPVPAAEWLYDWASIGTPVVIHY